MMAYIEGKVLWICEKACESEGNSFMRYVDVDVDVCS
jgi:hypothetical protein